MATVSLRHLYRKFGDVTAVNDVNIEIQDKEFLVLVGPSGCGKSTTLRLVAGLEEISSGEILIGDRVVNDVPPKDRDIAMVFQSYALYPHMNVYDNLAFGLRRRKTPKAEVDRRVRATAATLGIDEGLLQVSQGDAGHRQRSLSFSESGGTALNYTTVRKRVSRNRKKAVAVSARHRNGLSCLAAKIRLCRVRRVVRQDRAADHLAIQPEVVERRIAEPEPANIHMLCQAQLLPEFGRRIRIGEAGQVLAPAVPQADKLAGLDVTQRMHAP